jgi:protoporphyrinogen oxidase
MTSAVVGGGMLGLTLAWRLLALGHQVDLFEASPWFGGLATSTDYGEFRWDRFYHCILPSDERLIGLLNELGLGGELRWKRTRTGWFGGGRFHEMTGGADFLRFPLLSLLQKARLGAALACATRFSDPQRLYSIPAAEWLAKLCGRRTFEVFWKPLLRAKFGAYHDRVAAVFMWATLQRLWKRPASGQKGGTLGYVHGGYDSILRSLTTQLVAKGARLHHTVRISAIRAEATQAGTIRAGVPAPAGARAGALCRIDFSAPETGAESRSYDHVFFTAPVSEARRLTDAALRPTVERYAEEHPSASTYLGVACTVVVLKRPLTPYYVLNLADERLELTGVIEMTNLIDPAAETAGRSLVYLPRYADSADPLFEESDQTILQSSVDRGLKLLFPDLDERDVVRRSVHRARHVQALPVVQAAPRGPVIPPLEAPFQVVNSALLRAATLNNNEIVALADDFVAAHGEALTARAPAAAAAT